MNNKNTKNNILHKIMVLLVVFSLTVIDTVPLWTNTRAVTKEEVHTEGLQEETKEEELVEEELVEEELTEEELTEEELAEEELEEELLEEELIEEELIEEELAKTDKETNKGKGLLTTTFDTKVKSNFTNSNEAMVASTMATTSTYKMATDADFSGTRNGSFKYIGTDEYVEIPHRIKGVNVTSYYQMFMGTSVKGVKSTNKNVTSTQFMFYNSKASSLDLSNLDTSSVTRMEHMFNGSQATSLDLRNFDTSKVTNMTDIFRGSKTKDVYVRTQADANRFNGTSNKPTGLTFYVYEGDAPTGTITGNPTSWTKNNITLTFKASDASGVKRVQRPNGIRVNGSSTAYTVTSNGTYTFKAEDIFGNTGTFSVTVNRIDKTSPTVTFGTNGSSTASNSHSTTVNVTDTGSGVSTRQYQWTTSTTTPTSGTWSSFTNGATITRNTGNGNHYLHIRSTDVVGNTVNTRSNAFNLDTTAPTAPTLTASTTAWTNGNVTVTGTYPSDATVKQYRIGSGAWTNYTAPFTVTSNATVYARGQDSAGNWSTERSLAISNIDKTIPTVSFGTNGNSTARQSHSTTVSVTDTQSGVSTRQYQWSTSTATPTGTWTSFTNGATLTRSTGTGNIYLHIRATDGAGNVRNIRSNAFNMDNTAPTTPTLTANTTAWTNGNVTVTATYPTDATVKQYRIGSGAWTNYTAPFAVSANATIQARAQDSAGNWSTTRSLVISNIDKTAPNGTIAGNPTSWTNSNTTLTFNATDSGGSGVRRVRVKGGTWVNGTTTTQTATANGTYTFTVEDNAGNTRDVSVAVNRIDKTAPNGTISANTTAHTSGNVTLTFNATDTGGSSVRRVRVSGGTWVNGSTTTQVASSNGTFSFEVEDNAGNTRTVSHTVSNIDKTIPTVSLSKNGGGYAQTHSTVISASDNLSGVNTIQYRWTTNTTFPTSGLTTVTSGTTVSTPTTEGNHYLHVRATDKVGNVRNFTSNVFRVDRTAPTHVSNTVTGQRYTSGTNYWVRPNDVLTVNFRQQDTLSGNQSGYIRLLGNSQDVRYIHQFAGTATNMTPVNTTFVNTSSIEVQSVNRTEHDTTTGYGTTQWKVKLNTAGHNYELQYYHRDNASNNRGYATVGRLRVDGTAPTVTLTPNTTGHTNQNVTITATASDADSGVKRIQKPDGTWVNGSTTTHAVTSNGTYSFVVEDNVGNQRTQTLTVSNIDKTAPNGTITGNPTAWTKNNVTLTFNATDNSGGSGVRRVRIKDGTWVNGATTTQVATQNGTYAFEVEDNAGNTREVSVAVNKIDKTLPNGTITGNPTAWVNSNQTLTFTATDTGGSGVRRVRVKDGSWVNGSTTTLAVSSNGTYVFTVEDNAGNTRDVSIVVDKIDKTLPNGTISGNPTTWVNSNQTLTFTATDTGGSGVRRVRVKDGTWVNGATTTLAVSSNGTYVFTVEDNAGNTREVSVVVNRIDKTIPNGTISGNPTTWVNSNQTLTFTATDTGGSGVKRVRVKNGSWVSGATTTLTVSTNGTYVFEVEDNAGNTREVSVIVNRIDKTLPNGTITGNPTSWTNSNQTLSFNATDTGGSGVRRVRVKDGTWVNGSTTTLAVSSNGTYVFTVEDNAGNTRDVSVVVNRIDKSLPTGTITGNPTTWVNSNQTLTFTATDTGGSGVRRVRVKDGTWVNGSTTTLAVSSNGTYVFTVEDNAGNTRDESVVVNRIDKSLPTVSYGTNGSSTPRKSQSTTVNVTDTGSGVSTRQYQWTTSATFPTSGTWSNFTNGETITRNSGTGNYYLHIRATDVAGNVRQVTSNVFNVDNTAPIAPTYTPSTTGWTNGNVTVTINYPTDANVKEYRLGSGAWGLYTSTVTITSNNTIFARAFDLAGNESNTSSLQITNIDKTAPVLNIAGNPTDWTEEDEITLEVTTSDTLSGVRRITLPDNKVVTSSNATYKVVENGDYVFKVEDNAGNITTRTVTVDKLMVHYYLYIFDSKGNPVSGAKFELVRDGEVYRTATSESNGYLDFGKVPPVGKYTLRQVTNSDGIEIKDPVEIDQDVNDPIEIENPVEYPVGETLGEPVLTSNLNTWTNKDVKVTINYSTDSTIKQYKVNDGEWEEYKTPITLAENSTVYARAYDDVGNWSPETSLEITTIDKAIPTISIEINTKDWVSDKVELTVIAKDDASGVQTITSTQDLERISQETSGGTVRSTYLVTGNGSYEFTVTDKAGNTVIDTYTVNNIDKTVPEITVNGNPDDWFRDYELELEVITSDTQSGIKQVTMPDGTVVTGQELDTLTYKVTDNGSYEFIVEDNVGNKTTYTEEVTMLEKEFSVKVTDTGNKPLTGAEFELYRDGELIETVVSDNSGLVAFGTVYTSGDYEIRQTRVPEGYRLNNNILEVDVADDDINITNYHQSEVLPSTGTRDTLILLVMGLASITVLTVTNKKKRKLSKEV